MSNLPASYVAIPVKSPRRCLFCNRTKCYERIYTPCLGFDHVACPDHMDNLCAYADAVLGSNNGVWRTHSSSTGPQSRGEKDASDIELERKAFAQKAEATQ